MNREVLLELHQKLLSRRAFFTRSVQAAGLGLFWDKFGDQLFGQTNSSTDPYAVFSAIGNIVIPVDDDPGYATFEPGITQYAMNVIVQQVLLGGNPLLFQGIQEVLRAFNDLPPVIGYATAPFLSMNFSLQSQYYGNVLSGQFEEYGTQEVMFLAAFVGLFASKATFFSNYPHHLATPGADIQVVPTTGPKTGYQIMGYRGPVSQDEEQQLRTKYANIQTLPGMDPTNPYI